MLARSLKIGELLAENRRFRAECFFGHLAMDDEFWARMHAEFADDELADLTICCGMFLGMGRTLTVIGVRAPDERILI